jgi:hypothetical protein
MCCLRDCCYYLAPTKKNQARLIIPRRYAKEIACYFTRLIPFCFPTKSQSVPTLDCENDILVLSCCIDASMKLENYMLSL